MGIFDVLTLVCGLALFLFGMDVMGNALKKSAGNKLKVILGNLTSNKFKGFLLGLGVTAIIQSSSATTVMVVGFVNSGTMLLSQAIGIIFGSNLGTTVTAWLTALNGIEGGSEATVWLQYLKPDFWMPILSLIGICLVMFAKKNRAKDIGTILLGFSVLMVGMDLMSEAVSGLKDVPAFTQILTLFSNPILGVLAGTILTAVIQSSSASIGILQALSTTGAISFGAAIPIIMGQNIGTCITAILSSANANKNGKRTAFIHLYFNIIGTAVLLVLYYLVGWIFTLVGLPDFISIAEGSRINMWGIATVHTVFNLLAIILWAPFTGLLEKLACATVRGSDKTGDKFTDMLDERLLDTPSVAIDRCRAVIKQMSAISVSALKRSLSLFDGYDAKLADEIRADEEKADIYEDALGSYLVKLSSRDMDETDSHEVTKLLHMIGDFERISDHAVNLVESAEEMKDKEIKFSNSATGELSKMRGAVGEIVTITEEAFESGDVTVAARVEPLEQVVDHLKDEIKKNHIIRLQKSECSIEHGFILSDVLNNLERVSDHCSNIAGCLIEMSRHESLGVHEYLHNVKEGGEEFHRLHEEYMDKYRLDV